MKTYYIAATDSMSWGRGTAPWEALAHAIYYARDKATVAHLFEVKCPEPCYEEQVYVNQMGSIVAPSGSIVKEDGVIELKGISEKFIAYLEGLG